MSLHEVTAGVAVLAQETGQEAGGLHPYAVGGLALGILLVLLVCLLMFGAGREHS